MQPASQLANYQAKYVSTSFRENRNQEVGKKGRSQDDDDEVSHSVGRTLTAVAPAPAAAVYLLTETYLLGKSYQLGISSSLSLSVCE